MEVTSRYKKVSQLNSENSPSTGAIVCFDGCIPGEHNDFSDQYIEISDCYHKIRLHRAHFDSVSDWVDKIDTLLVELQDYRNHIVRNKKVIEKEIYENSK